MFFVGSSFDHVRSNVCIVREDWDEGTEDTDRSVHVYRTCLSPASEDDKKKKKTTEIVRKGKSVRAYFIFFDRDKEMTWHQDHCVLSPFDILLL